MFDGPHTAQPRPLRLAIVSTYDDLCGIAGYTRALEHQLRPHAEVQVFDLDQYLLRSPHQRVQRLADLHIQDIASRLQDFDSVNIQLEYGTLGRTRRQILRRLRRLVLSARAASVTFHTVLGNDPFPWPELGRRLAAGRLIGGVRAVTGYFHAHGLATATYGFLRRRQRRQRISVIVHTRRDARLLRDVFRLQNVDHHPLSFISPAQADAVRRCARRSDFPTLSTLPPGARVIGTFGFLSPYKGFDTALRALHYLPDDCHLLIFGGVHPQGIQRHQKLDPYIQALLQEGHIGINMIDAIGDKKVPMTVNLDAACKDLLAHHPNDLQHRVHFMGVHDDEAFMRAMALCNAVVLPYLEVGQSSSGPISMALEMGCRVIASRTLAFLQFARYHPNQIEFFDIGNFAELADLIRADLPLPAERRVLDYNTDTNVAMYLAASRPAPAHAADKMPVQEPEAAQ